MRYFDETADWAEQIGKIVGDAIAGLVCLGVATVCADILFRWF